MEQKIHQMLRAFCILTLSIFYYLKQIIDKYIFKYTYLSKYVHDTAYIYIHDIHDISKNKNYM